MKTQHLLDLEADEHRVSARHRLLEDHACGRPGWRASAQAKDQQILTLEHDAPGEDRDGGLGSERMIDMAVTLLPQPDSRPGPWCCPRPARLVSSTTHGGSAQTKPTVGLDGERAHSKTMRESEGHHPGHVDDLADAQIAGDAAEQIGVDGGGAVALRAGGSCRDGVTRAHHRSGRCRS
jgi:hypothetical protein